MTKELKKGKLYLLDLDLEEKEIAVGYVHADKGIFFKGAVFSVYDGKFYGPDTISWSMEQFNDFVKSFREIG